MAKTIVGVLRGGTSNEYNLSLKTGAAIMAALPEDAYETRDILIDKQGFWHLRGKPVTPARALAQIDVVVSALHGGVGEDGSVHRILDRSGVPYPGSRALPSGFSLNKVRARTFFQRAGVQTPRSVAFTLSNDMSTGDMAQAVFQQFGPPYVVKPVSEGSSYGIKYAPTVLELAEAIADVLDSYGAAIVQEFLMGDEFHVGVIENFRGQDLYALPPAHVVRPAGSRYVESAHHEQGILKHNVPSNFTIEQKQQIAELAKSAYRSLSMAHYAGVDIILTRRGPHVLEVDSIPHLFEGSAFPRALEAVGSSLKEFLEHAIRMARG
ncbi:MAG: ATP-grasp domain-containing protein [Candidatus Kaiserbacteria bacterium]|nr:MAG: ATP-grasp domain-containing protein [Candidatus Kaiserbacteria bacterium]